MGDCKPGHYARKHPETQRDTAVADRLEKLADDRGCLNCTDAHKAAGLLGLPPKAVGIQADLSELRLARCQLGLFGHYPSSKQLDPDVHISPELDLALDQAKRENRISCAECWELAQQFGVPRLDMGSACEKKGIRVRACQLGAF